MPRKLLKFSCHPVGGSDTGSAAFAAAAAISRNESILRIMAEFAICGLKLVSGFPLQEAFGEMVPVMKIE